jgi:hypothetical protein
MKLGHATTEYRRKNSEASRERGEGRTGGALKVCRLSLLDIARGTGSSNPFLSSGETSEPTVPLSA